MKDSIVPALVGFMIGLPSLAFAILQWAKTWGRENRQIATTGMEAALREGHAVLNQRLDFERVRREEAETEKKEIEDENEKLRAENFDLRVDNASLRKESMFLKDTQELLKITMRLEERSVTDDRE